VIVLVRTHPGQPNLDKTAITTYEYDSTGNWTRRTIVRAVNPVDEEGKALEEAVEVTERKIVYGTPRRG
jgi:hypothetical protein